MDSEELERRASLILGYFNQEAIRKIVDSVLSVDEDTRKRFAAQVLKLLPELFNDDMRRATQEWMFQILRKMVTEGYFWKKAEPLIRAAMDKYIEQVVDELAQKELKNMAREAIRAQLKKGY